MAKIRTWKRWKRWEDEYLLAHYSTTSYKDIAATLGRSCAAIMARTVMLGVRKERAWTKEMLGNVRDMLAMGKSYEEIAARYGSTVSAVRSIVKRYHIKTYRPPLRRWTEEEDAVVRQMAEAGLRDKDIAERLGRPQSSVTNRRISLGVFRNRTWTDEEVEYLRKVYSSTRAADIAKTLGRTEKTIYGKAHSLGLKKPHEWFRQVCGKMLVSHIRKWTQEEDEYIRVHYPDEPAEDVAKVLGRTVNAVRKRAIDSHIRKSPEYMHTVRMESLRGCQAKSAEGYRRLVRLERCRVALGLPQKTRIRIGREPKDKARMRRWLMRYGYIMMDGDRRVLYYTHDTVRKPHSEATAAKFGLKIKSIDEYGNE